MVIFVYRLQAVILLTSVIKNNIKNFKINKFIDVLLYFNNQM
jgi:hypothetical protein